MKTSPVDCVIHLFSFTYYLTEKLTDEQIPYDRVTGNYAKLIKRSKKQAQSAGIPKKEFDRALFPVCAWIDEVILETNWEYKLEWVKNSLQKKYFNTTSAGAQFFENLNKLKSEDTGILEVYDYCLASGFKGSLHDKYDSEKLSRIQTDILKKVQDENLSQLPGIIFPDAGSTDFDKRLKRKRWKGLSNYTSLFVLLPVLLFLVLYYIFDQRLTAIKDLLM